MGCERYLIPYPVITDDQLFKTMHITPAQVIAFNFGRKTLKVVLVETDDRSVFEGCIREIWSWLSKEARATRCLVSDNNGGFIRCQGDCKDCSKVRCGLPDSLDAEQEINGFEVTDPSLDAVEIKTLQMTLEDLFVKLRNLNPQYAAIIEGIYHEKTHHEIGLELGKSESAVQEQAKRALNLAKIILSD